MKHTATKLSKKNKLVIEASDRPTKREYFAAMAMQGLLSNTAESDISISHIKKLLIIEDYDPNIHYALYIANLAVIHANALISELNNTNANY